MEGQIAALPRSRRLRRNRAYAEALAALEDAFDDVWQEQSSCDDIPGVWADEESLERAAEELEVCRDEFHRLEAPIAEAGALVAILDDTIRATFKEASWCLAECNDPPGQTVAKSPRQSTGPPRRCALDLIGTAHS
jgi:hypothetical protein